MVRAGAAAPLSGERLLIVVLFGSQSALFLTLLAGWLAMAAWLELHLGLCAIVAALGLCRACLVGAAEHAGQRTAVLLQATGWSLLAGPFGSAMAAALVVSRTSTAGGEAAADAGAPERLPPPPLTRLERLHGILLDRRLRLEHAHDIRPLLDVMIDGNQLEKLEALGLIAKRFVPGLAPALRRGLEDRDASVRVLAATVIAQQHTVYTKRIGELLEHARAAPDAEDHWQNLAQARCDYANSGLLDTSRAEGEERQARADLVRATRVVESGAA